MNRKSRRCAANPVAHAIRGARKLAEHERARILQPTLDAFGRLREGIGAEGDWMALASACNVAMAIERQGVVRGLREHLHSTELSLAMINRRAQDERGRYPYALHLAEIEQLQTFITVHSYQLGALSRREYEEATDYAIAEVQSSGGMVIQSPTYAMEQEALPL